MVEVMAATHMRAKKAVLVRAGLNICWNTSGNVMNVS